jgi:hypothetical protein
MNDPNSPLFAYDRYHLALEKASQANKDIVFDALAAAHITSVVVEFDGEDDSGQISGMTAFRGEEQVELPALRITLQQASWNHAELGTMEEPLPQAVETLCYDYLEHTHGGWENNEGAYGEFRLDVGARSVALEFNARYMDIATENHTF